MQSREKIASVSTAAWQAAVRLKLFSLKFVEPYCCHEVPNEPSWFALESLTVCRIFHIKLLMEHSIDFQSPICASINVSCDIRDTPFEKPFGNYANDSLRQYLVGKDLRLECLIY